jgi:hypothetical protein
MIRAVLQQGRFRFGTIIVFPELSLRSPHQIWVNCTDEFDKCNLPDGMGNYRVLPISGLKRTIGHALTSKRFPWVVPTSSVCIRPYLPIVESVPAVQP